MQSEPIKNDYPAVIDLLMQDVTTDRQFPNNTEALILAKTFELVLLLKMYKDNISDPQETIKALVQDAQERVEIGVSRYGVALQPFNGRSFTRDLYEEALDALFYARGHYYEKHKE